METARRTGSNPPTGVLIVGHGTTSEVGAEECRRVARQAAGRLTGRPVFLGFLELTSPSIEDAMAGIAAAGCREVVVVPVLLFSAGHARRDVPEEVRRAAETHGISVRQADVIGCHDAVVELARVRHTEAAGGRPADGQTRTVMVGRGSSEPTAAAQLRDFADRVFAVAGRGDATDGEPAAGSVGLGFVAAARPTLDEAIAAAAAAGPRRVIIHPHLLFHGHVEAQVAGRIDRARREHQGIEWVVVGRLGADTRVAEALADRAMEAIEKKG